MSRRVDRWAEAAALRKGAERMPEASRLAMIADAMRLEAEARHIEDCERLVAEKYGRLAPPPPPNDRAHWLGQLEAAIARVREATAAEFAAIAAQRARDAEPPPPRPTYPMSTHQRRVVDRCDLLRHPPLPVQRYREPLPFGWHVEDVWAGDE